MIGKSVHHLKSNTKTTKQELCKEYDDSKALLVHIELEEEIGVIDSILIKYV